jgi:hypothetical protein
MNSQLLQSSILSSFYYCLQTFSKFASVNPLLWHMLQNATFYSKRALKYWEIFRLRSTSFRCAPRMSRDRQYDVSLSVISPDFISGECSRRVYSRFFKALSK